VSLRGFGLGNPFNVGSAALSNLSYGPRRILNWSGIWLLLMAGFTRFLFGAEAYLDRVGRWTPSTRVGYGVALAAFARSHRAENVGVVVNLIKAGELDPYAALERYVGSLAGEGLAPKTIRAYVTAARGLLRHEGIRLDDYEVRLKVGLPPNVEASLDRIPTRDEPRILLLDSNHRTRALTALLATSGLCIGEAAGLRAVNVNLDQEKVTVMALRSKSRSTRITFISPETAQILRDYIRLEHLTTEDWLFPDNYDRTKPAGRNALYSLIRRTLDKTGLRKKLDPASAMYDLHPHAFRKYFFTKLIAAGVDRGVAEYLMGHKFGLDNAYLRMDEDRLRKEYAKAEADFTFLSESKKQENEEISSLRDQLRELRLAVRMLQDASELKANISAQSLADRSPLRA
jgi:integrase